MKLISQLTIRSGQAGQYLHRRIGAFIADRRGFSAMTFAISAIPMFGLVGLAVDVGTAFHMKAQVQQAADIVATQLARRSMLDGNLTSEDLIERGKQMMANNLEFAVTYEKFEVQLTNKEVEIDAQAQYNTNFSKMVGISKLDISATAKARYEVDEADIFILVDNTPSMLLAATQAEATRMLQQRGCEFACHQATAGDSYSIARANGYQLRFDVVSSALQSLTTRISTIDPSSQSYRVSLYHFGTNGAPNLTEHLALTNSMTTVNTAVTTLQPMIAGGRATDFQNILAAMRAEMTAKRIAGRTQILLLITDGLHDSPVQVPNTYNDQWIFLGPVHNSFCTNIKNDGVIMAVLDTPYLSPSFAAAPWYKFAVPKLAGALKSCASTGLCAAVDFTNANSYAAQMEMLITKAGKKNLRLVRD